MSGTSGDTRSGAGGEFGSAVIPGVWVALVSMVLDLGRGVWNRSAGQPTCLMGCLTGYALPPWVPLEPGV